MKCNQPILVTISIVDNCIESGASVKKMFASCHIKSGGVGGEGRELQFRSGLECGYGWGGGEGQTHDPYLIRGDGRAGSSKARMSTIPPPYLPTPSLAWLQR